jgi:hypothetical protein
MAASGSSSRSWSCGCPTRRSQPGGGRASRSAARLPARSEDDVCQGVGDGLVGGRQDVAVGVEGDRDRRMPERGPTTSHVTRSPVSPASSPSTTRRSISRWTARSGIGWLRRSPEPAGRVRSARGRLPSARARPVRKEPGLCGVPRTDGRCQLVAGTRTGMSNAQRPRGAAHPRRSTHRDRVGARLAERMREVATRTKPGSCAPGLGPWEPVSFRAHPLVRASPQLRAVRLVGSVDGGTAEGGGGFLQRRAVLRLGMTSHTATGGPSWPRSATMPASTVRPTRSGRPFRTPVPSRPGSP